MSLKEAPSAASHGIHPRGISRGPHPRFQRLDRLFVNRVERLRLDVARFLKHIASQLGEQPTEIALRSISVAELAHSIHRANTPERHQARRAFLDDLKATVPVYPITADTGELVGKIHAESSQKGIVIPFDDLLIGACALERGFAITTRNPPLWEDPRTQGSGHLTRMRRPKVLRK